MRLPFPSKLLFRQLLLVAFLLITALLGAVLLRGLYTLEELVNQAQAGAQRAVVLSTETQALGERLAAMERSARQFLVLDDPASLERFEQAAAEAEAGLVRQDEQLGTLQAPAWPQAVARVRQALQGPRDMLALRERTVGEAFAELAGHSVFKRPSKARGGAGLAVDAGPRPARMAWIRRLSHCLCQPGPPRRFAWSGFGLDIRAPD